MAKRRHAAPEAGIVLPFLSRYLNSLAVEEFATEFYRKCVTGFGKKFIDGYLTAA
jgi:hypothetical protein